MAKQQKQSKQNKIRLFISYSRRDFGKIEKLYEVLSGDDELDVYLDQHDIAAAEDWKQRLDGLIRSSDTILFAVSRDSVASDICQWEIDLATQLNKRIIPVIINDVADEDVPEEIARLNYVFARTDKELIPALASIGDALKIDIDWIREHTRLADMAHRWEQASKLGAQPLRGKELEAAEQWLSNQPKDAPAPTELQRKYIYESRKSATKRQRMTVMGSIAAMLIVGVLAGFAFVQRNAAIEGERKAEAALRTATEAANTMVIDLAQSLQNKPVPVSIVRRVIGQAQKLQKKLSANFPYDFKLQSSIAAGHLLAGDIQRELNDSAGAKAEYESSLLINRKLTEKYPEDTAPWREISVAFERIGDVHRNMGELDDALNVYLESLDISRRFSGADDKIRNWDVGIILELGRIADVYEQLGKYGKAKIALDERIEKAQILSQSDPENAEWKGFVASSHMKIGVHIASTQSNVDALPAYKDALKIYRKLIQLEPNNIWFKSSLAEVLDKIANIHLQSGKNKEARLLFEKSVQIARELHVFDTEILKHKLKLVTSLNYLSRFEAKHGHIEKAVRYVEEAESIISKATQNDPANQQLQGGFAVTLTTKSLIDEVSGKLWRAIDHAMKAERIRNKIVGKGVPNMREEEKLALVQELIGRLSVAVGKKLRASEMFAKALEFRRKAVSSNSSHGYWVNALTNLLFRYSNLAFDVNKIDFAQSLIDEALSVRRKQISQNPHVTEYQNFFADELRSLSNTYKDRGNNKEAFEMRREALKIYRTLVNVEPNEKKWKFGVVINLFDKGLHLEADGKAQEGIANFVEAVEIVEHHLKSNPEDLDASKMLASIYEVIAEVEFKQEQLGAAQRTYLKISKIYKNLIKNTPHSIELNSRLLSILQNLARLQKSNDALREWKASQILIVNTLEILANLSQPGMKWRMILAKSYDELGYAEVRAGNAKAAIRAFQDSLEIKQKIAALDEYNIEWQMDLVAGYYRVAMVDSTKIHYFTEALEILQRLNAEGHKSANQTEWIKRIDKEIAKNE